MTTHVYARSPQQTTAETIFRRVVVGVDGSEESVEAARQASTLATASPSLVAAYTLELPVLVAPAGYAYDYADEDELRDRAAAALQLARDRVDRLETAPARVESGIAWDVLLHEIEAGDATLVAVGSHGRGRLAGILLGSVATTLLHKAPCSVLVARKGSPGFPRRIVVGVDGSPESAAAYATAQYLAQRFGASLWPVVAHGGKHVDKAAVDAIVDHTRDDSPDVPVGALVTASTEADLVVVGSRGLHGLDSLGSVSERVAHEAKSSVLVVRRP